MTAQHILQLEQQLLSANQAMEKLTLANAELIKQVADAEARNKKLRRTSRSEESTLKDQLTIAQNRRV